MFIILDTVAKEQLFQTSEDPFWKKVHCNLLLRQHMEKLRISLQFCKFCQFLFYVFFLKSFYFEIADTKLNWDAKIQKLPQRTKNMLLS